MNVIAIYATILMCLNGDVSFEERCADGRSAESVNLSILSGTSPDSNCGPQLNQKCLDEARWESILKIEHDGKTLFDWRADGTVARDPGFASDKAAEALLRSVDALLKNRGLKLQ